MVKRKYDRILALGILLATTLTSPMVDLKEEFLTVPEQESSEIITESAMLSEPQKKAIQAALAKMFGDQRASTTLYGEMVTALTVAMATPEVEQASKRFVQGLKDLVKIFFKNMNLSNEQSAKMRDVLETLKALALLQLTHFDPQAIDDAAQTRMLALQERLSAHLVPLSLGVQSVLSQEMIDLYQKHIVQLILDLVKDVLAILPTPPTISGLGNPPLLAEPIVPERIVIMQEEVEE